MSAQVMVRWVEEGVLRLGTLADVPDVRKRGTAVWIDVVEPDIETLTRLQVEFGLHPLAIEDCLHISQRVKLDLYPEAAFLVWIFPRRVNGSSLAMVELEAFLGDGFLITSHSLPVPAIDRLGSDAAGVLVRGADWTLHDILDRGVDDLFPLVDHLSDELDEIEDVLLGDPDKQDLQRLFGVKRQLVTVYRVVTGERDVIRGMARREQFVSEDAYMYFQNVGDHLARAIDTIDTYRDVASSAVDIYLSAVNNRLSDVMKKLTIVATIFMPLTLISGIYGMNVTKGMWPPSGASWSFPFIIGSLVVIGLWMLTYFRRRRWW